MDNNLWIQFPCGHIVSPMPKVGPNIFSCEYNTKIPIKIVPIGILGCKSATYTSDSLLNNEANMFIGADIYNYED